MRLCPFALTTFLLTAPASAFAQVSPQSLEGMWSDPPVTLQDALCRAYCTQPLLDYFDALLADPANDERAVTELSSEARDHQSTQYFRPRLSPAALETVSARTSPFG